MWTQPRFKHKYISRWKLPIFKCKYVVYWTLLGFTCIPLQMKHYPNKKNANILQIEHCLHVTANILQIGN